MEYISDGHECGRLEERGPQGPRFHINSFGIKKRRESVIKRI